MRKITSAVAISLFVVFFLSSREKDQTTNKTEAHYSTIDHDSEPKPHKQERSLAIKNHNPPDNQDAQEPLSSEWIEASAEQFCSNRVNGSLNPVELKYCIPKSVVDCEYCPNDTDIENCEGRLRSYRILFKETIGFHTYGNNLSSAEVYAVISSALLRSKKTDRAKSIAELYEGLHLHARKYLNRDPGGYCISKANNCVSEESSRQLTNEEVHEIQEENDRIGHMEAEYFDNCVYNFKKISGSIFARNDEEETESASTKFRDFRYRKYNAVILSYNTIHNLKPQMGYFIIGDDGRLSGVYSLDDGLSDPQMDKAIMEEIDDRHRWAAELKKSTTQLEH